MIVKELYLILSPIIHYGLSGNLPKPTLTEGSQVPQGWGYQDRGSNQVRNVHTNPKGQFGPLQIIQELSIIDIREVFIQTGLPGRPVEILINIHHLSQYPKSDLWGVVMKIKGQYPWLPFLGLNPTKENRTRHCIVVLKVLGGLRSVIMEHI